MIILVFSVLALNWQSLIIFSSLTHFKISHPKSIITPLILFPGAIESEQLLKIVYKFLIFSYFLVFCVAVHIIIEILQLPEIHFEGCSVVFERVLFWYSIVLAMT